MLELKDHKYLIFSYITNLYIILVMINNNQQCTLNHTTHDKSPFNRERACLMQSGYIMSCVTTLHLSLL